MAKNDRSDILSFFLNIYKLQLGGRARDARVEPLSSDNRSPEAIYELRVLQDDHWKSRRMSIVPLAEDSGSKSRCYKVTYDDNLVVKMPPSPPSDFARYMEHIDRERMNAFQLQPEVECITPTVSAILRRIPPFSNNVDLPADQFEEKCIHMLKLLPHFQDYLKIGGRFAFFMNLSRYAFLGQVVRDMHQVRDLVKREMVQHVSTLEDILPFESRYGKENAHVFFEINDVYAEFEEALKPILAACKVETPVSAYQKREWFWSFIAKKFIDEGDNFPCPDGVADVNRVLDDICTRNAGPMTTYKNMVINYVFAQSFERNRSAMSGIITNLLELLGILREKGVAMRDLKPDNVFVAGDIGSAPDFLAQSHAYTIGLIDFETAVNIAQSRSNRPSRIDQPMLSGTPSYATPSHLFRNIVLTAVFDKALAKILHIQDWQAIVAMIYNIVIGRRLSEKSGQLFPEIMKIIKRTQRNSNYSQEKVFKVCSRAFWQGTRSEMKEKLESHRRFLESVKPLVPEKARRMFREELDVLRTDLIKQARMMVYSQNIFRTEKSRRGLMKATSREVRNYIEDWKAGGGPKDISDAARKVVIRFLGNLEVLKKRIERQSDRLARLEGKRIRLSAAELMDLMYDVTINVMYREEWAKESSDITTAPQPEAQSGNDKTIVCYEDTVEIEKTLSMMLHR